jgi:hypothetical protein
MAKIETAKRYAIIVGVTTYEDDQIASLQYTKNDAIRMADLLIQKGGFDRQRVYLLVNGIREDDRLPVDAMSPTRGELLHRIKYAADSAEKEDLILLFFAGHGTEVSKNPYLLTSDTKMDVLQHTAVKVTDVNDLLEQSKARCVLRIFDACRSPFGEARGLTGRMTDGLQTAMMKTATGWASFSSCSSGEIAHESGELEHGIFTYYLCEGLEGKAASDSGEVSFERLVDYVKTSVGNWSDEQSQSQTPHVQSDLSGQLILVTLSKVSVIPLQDSQNPLDILRFGIDKHLSKIPEDTRNLTFTNEKELVQVFQLAESAIGQLVQDFSHPSFVITVGGKMGINKIGGIPWQVFNNDIRDKKVKSEYRSQMNAIQIRFLSSEVVLPHTTLTVGVSQFSFFYWLWYLHECDQKQLQWSFNADPHFKKGFFTFKPKAALDGRKMENTVKELFKRVCEDILSWTNQLSQLVDTKITPLREMGKIVE